jgi:S-formylglutathione hydrolase FrmB
VLSLAAALTDAGVVTELVVSSGNHNRPYWSAHLAEYLAWYARHIGA